MRHYEEPVVAYCRIADQPIRLREPIMAPDVLIVQDPTLLHQVDVFQGLTADGYVLINSRRSFHDLGLAEIEQRHRVPVVPHQLPAGRAGADADDRQRAAGPRAGAAGDRREARAGAARG